jgi:hypothetical protein
MYTLDCLTPIWLASLEYGAEALKGIFMIFFGISLLVGKKIYIDDNL